MKPLKISARYSRKVNLGDFESVEAELMIIAEVEEVDGKMEDVKAVAELTHQQCKEAVWRALEADIQECRVQKYLPKKTYKMMGKVVEPASKNGRIINRQVNEKSEADTLF